MSVCELLGFLGNRDLFTTVSAPRDYVKRLLSYDPQNILNPGKIFDT